MDIPKNDIIKFIDPGKLMYFVSTLYDRSPLILQKKINRYLQDATSSVVVFIIQERRAHPKSIIRIIGQHELQHKIEIESESLILQKVKEQNGANIKEDSLDPIFKIELNKILQKKYFKIFENCLILPIYHPISKKLCIYVGFVNYPNIFGQENFMRNITEGCFRYALPVLKSSFALEDEKHHRKMGENLFKSVVSMLGNSEDEFYSYKAIRREAMKLFNAEDCHVHLTDINFGYKLIELYEVHKPSWRDASKTNVHDALLPQFCNIAQAVVETGKLINCKDLQKEPRAHPDLVKVKDGLCLIENSLSFPILINGQIKGIIEVFNKLLEPYFTEDDEEFTTGFGIASGSLMKCVNLYRKVKEKYHVRSLADCILLRHSRISAFKTKKYKISEPQIMNKSMLHFNFNIFDMLDKDIEPNIMMMFRKLHFLSKLDVDEMSFTRFISAVIKATPQLPFHNALHSFNAFQFIVQLIKNCKIRKIFQCTTIELFMLLVASLAQDVEWRGPTTPFQVVRGCSLAALYTSPGMVEKRLTVSQVIRMLTLDEFNLFKYMDIENNKLCMVLLHDMILATDITNYILKKPDIELMLKTGYQGDNVKHRKLLHQLIMTTAQFSIFSKCWDTYTQVSERINKEFFRQGDLSYAEKGSEFVSIVPTQDRIASLHFEFLNNYCIPAFQLLHGFLPRIGECIERLEDTKLRWDVVNNDYLIKRQQELEEELERLRRQRESDSDESSDSSDEED